MRRILLGVGLGVWALAVVTGLPGLLTAQNEIKVPFKVFAVADPKTAVYEGEFIVSQEGAIVTEKQFYRKPGNKDAVIERVSVFDLDSRRPISFTDRNQLAGKFWKAKVDGGKISVRIEDLKGNVDTDKTVSLPKETFIWANFFYVLPRDWDKLPKGSDSYEMRIFVLSRQDDYGMQVKSEGDVSVGGIAGRRFRLEPSSAFLRAVAPATRVTFANDPPHRAIMYQGEGAVLGSDGKPLDSTIVFEWPKS